MAPRRRRRIPAPDPGTGSDRPDPDEQEAHRAAATREASRGALRIALSFALFGILWVVLSDHLLYSIASLQAPGLKHLQTVKGVLFVGLGSAFLYLLSRGRLLRLSTSESRYRSLFEGVPVGVFRSTPAGEILDVNRRLVDMLGFPDRATLLATNAREVYVEPAERQRWRAAVERGSEAVEVRLKRHDGALIWARMRTRVTYDAEGRAQLYEGSIEDVTPEKEAEAHVRESEERFRATFEQAQVGIAHVGPDWRWLRVNSRLCEFLGRSRDELLETSFADISHPDDLEPDLGQAERLRRGEIESYTLEKRFLRPDGAVVWGSLTASAVRDEAGRPKYFIGVVQDITERRLAEQALAEKEEEVRQSQKMEAVGRLAGGVAHDINNVLTAINGYARFVLDELPETGDARSDVLEIVKAADRATAIVRQLLTFSRREVRRPEVVDAGDVVRGMEAMLRRLIREDIELVAQLDPRPCPVLVDRNQIDQVLMNFAVNARDAMPSGGRLLIRTTLVTGVDAPDEAEGAPLWLRLRVTDTGVGMSPEVVERIFEPFFTTKSEGQGTGLGLSTVYGIVKQSGGTIDVETAPGAGTTFRVHLPLAEVQPVVGAEPAAPGKGSAERTVLLVEDEPAVRSFARRVLLQAGYAVVEADDGARALRELDARAGVVDVVLSDALMPGMGGVELARRLAESHPGLPIVLMSGFAEGKLSDDGALRDGMGYLQKPFSPDALKRAVHAALRAPPA